MLTGFGRKDLPRWLRLALATGALLIGFGLVIAMVALALAAGDAPVPSASAASYPRSGSGSADASPTPGPLNYQPGAILTTLHGTGTQSSRAFHVPSPGTWGLAWSYHGCPDNDPGVFTVGETRTTADHSLRISGSAGSDHGTTWFRDDPGWHSVVIVSRCSWRLNVVTPRPEKVSGGSSGSSGRGDGRSQSPYQDSDEHHYSHGPSPSSGPGPGPH